MESKQERERLLGRLSKIDGKKIAIIGDIGLDQYLVGTVKRISPEAPVPVVEVDHEEFRLGLAGNVAQNISSLGGTPLLFSVVGGDQIAKDLKAQLDGMKISPEFLILDSDRPTTKKLRILSGQHHIVRADIEKRRFISEQIEKELLSCFTANVNGCDAVVIEDYAKGVISQTCCQKVIEIAKRAGKPILVDPSRLTPASYYTGADVIKPNRDEAIALSNLAVDDLRVGSSSIVEAGMVIMKETKASHLVITDGSKGVILFSKDEVQRIPTQPSQVFDVVGAGDTVIAMLALAWAAEIDPKDACDLANFAAGLVVGKVGCVPCDRQELEEGINR